MGRTVLHQHGGQPWHNYEAYLLVGRVVPGLKTMIVNGVNMVKDFINN